MELTMLGTGNALVTECYNTCFVLKDKEEYFMVDGGGGNGVLHQLKHAGIDWKQIHTIFVTHKHVDHIMGIIWMMRMICQYLLLYHTEDKNIADRKHLYEEEGHFYYHGNLFIPEDLEKIIL